jgi:hypothetical protein
MDGAWVVKMVWGFGGWFVVWIKNIVENGAMVVCGRTNGRCELQGSMKHDKLRDMGHFVPIKKKFY